MFDIIERFGSGIIFSSNTIELSILAEHLLVVGFSLGPKYLTGPKLYVSFKHSSLVFKVLLMVC